MITVGFDFGTHQTKVCYETIEAGTTFYDVFKFEGSDGAERLTLPSFIRICADGTLKYGHEAVLENDGMEITYFKQKMFSWELGESSRAESEKWSVLFLAFVIFKLDAHFRSPRYIIHMGMPTDADRQHYAFCKGQAIKVMAGAMQMARSKFKGDIDAFLRTPYLQLKSMASQCMDNVPSAISEARRTYPILVFPEAYVALIPLINDHRLPEIGPNLFVDIGGGTVDISFFTNLMDGAVAQNRPCLYYYHSIPCGLNMITGQDISGSHNVEIGAGQITIDMVRRFRISLVGAVDEMMRRLRSQYEDMGRASVMPFSTLCKQILEDRPICYSGGGSMFQDLKLAIASRGDICYKFSGVTTVSELIDHSRLYVDNKMFHVLATAFALSHQSLINRLNRDEPDSIKLVSLDKLFEGVKIPQMPKAREYASYVNGFGTAGLVKEDYTLDLQRARAGDADAKLRINKAKEYGNVPTGITIADELMSARLKQMAKEKEEEREQARYIAEQQKKNADVRKNSRLQIVNAKAAFKAGDFRMAIKVATLILNAPDFSSDHFEEARTWLNLAREKGLVSMKLLKLFAQVCRQGRIPNAKAHLGRYLRIIGDCKHGKYSNMTFCDV